VIKRQRPALFFGNRAEWRAWLRSHHERETEAWVAHVKKGSRRQGLPYEEGVEEGLCYGWIDGLTRSLDADYFLQRYTPRKPGSIWSESNKARVENLIRQGRMTAAGMRKVDAAKANGQWDAAAQREDPAWIPPGLRAALVRRAGALEAFRALPPSVRQMHAYAFSAAKRPETRARRAQAAIDEALTRKKPRAAPRPASPRSRRGPRAKPR
jgi:uncharacterized protein YdeI (YjbR/CyaY-like superfamily)